MKTARNGKTCPFFRKKDIGWLTALCAAALLVYALTAGAGLGAQPAEVRVSVNGVWVLTVPLSQNAEYRVPGQPGVLIAVRDNTAGFTASDCPDQLCVRTGFLCEAGETAVCLPNRVSLQILGGSSGGVDAVAY